MTIVHTQAPASHGVNDTPPPAVSGNNAAPLTDLEVFLAAKADEAIARGTELHAWWRANEAKLLKFPLELITPLRSEATGYFGETVIAGEKRTAMACKQHIHYGIVNRPNAAELLREFVLGQFLTRAHWNYPDGMLGGFTVTRSLYKTTDGQIGRFANKEHDGSIDWRELGSRFNWALLTIMINDFSVDLGPIHKHVEAAAVVAPSKAFMRVEDNPAPGCKLSIEVGYPFVEYAPIPSVFGYGPGKFGTAFKSFRFTLSDSNEMEVEMLFCSAPRSQKVFDFGKRIPCPIYGMASLLSAISGGRWGGQKVHDTMDREMLVKHVRVHQKLVEGLLPIWKAWLQEQDRAAAMAKAEA